jgi:quinol-cytochrome oxidoreductase complex cytochrome b subunit
MLNGMLDGIRGFMNLDRAARKAKIMEAVDNRVRIITAGLSLKELRALMRGEPPTEKPNPRYKVHVTSFIAHIRPKFYYKASTKFTHTFRLGYLTSLMFLVEIITGLVLMVYYVPSPEGAYPSILAIESNVMFGELMRDMHRLGAELMVIFVWLHLFRTYFTGSYKGQQSFTWLTGVFLLLITVFLSFTGYLLPWDQLAYWAVTIGTSMADKAPAPAGPISNLLLRGSPDIGAGGLLRFYLLHVILLPLAGILVLSIHYYKVAREHGISLPAVIEEGDLPAEEVKDAKKRIDLIPDLLSHEIYLACLVTALMLIYLLFFYAGAPLEHHANPLQTPLDTKSPWYFWWVQGLLKLGDPLWMGVIWPNVFIVILLAIPYIDRNPKRMAKSRPFAISWGIFWIAALLIWSYMGLPQFGIETPPAVRIVQDLAPEEGEGMLREIPFEALVPGQYVVNEMEGLELLPTELADFLVEFETRVNEQAEIYEETKNEGEEAKGFNDPYAVIHITEWQPDLMKITFYMSWTDPVTGAPKEYEHDFYLHAERQR